MENLKKELLACLRHEDLLQATLLLGKVQDPNFCPAPYMRSIVELAAQVRGDKKGTLPNDPVALIKKINQVLFTELKLEGKTERYKQLIDDEGQYFLHALLDSKKGAPITYAALYAVLINELGFTCEVLAFPSHYYIRVQDTTGEFYVNPFEGGKLTTSYEFQKKFKASMQRNRLLSAKLFEVLTPQGLVARLAQQLKHVYILKNSALQALRAVEILTSIYPDSPELARDRGVLYCEMEYFSKARDDLRFYLSRRPKADDAKEIKRLTFMLRGYCETMN